MAHLLGIDSNVWTYLLQANSGQYDPFTDPHQKLAKERVAAYRIFLYQPVLSVVPRVSKEIEAIPDPKLREEHERLRDVLLHEIHHLDEHLVEVDTERGFK